MSVESNLILMEKSREAYWRKYQSTTPIKLRWRAVTVRHCFHALPGETILELGAGSGLWTAQLSEVLSGRNPIVGAVFYSDFLEQANEKKIASAKFILIKNLTRELQEASFDYGTSEGAIDSSIVANHNPAAEIFNLGHHRNIKNDG